MRTNDVARVTVTRALLAAGLVVGPLTCTVFTVEGRRRSGYDPARHPVSALSLGGRGWVQQANFFASGALTLLTAAGLLRSGRDGSGRCPPVGPLAVAAAGAGLIGAGVFPTDPVPGYPEASDPPTGVRTRALTRTGTLHVLSAVPFFVGLPAASIDRAFRAWQDGRRTEATAHAGLAAVGLVASATAGAAFGGRTNLEETGGRWQRISVAAGFAGLAGISAHALALVGPTRFDGSPIRIVRPT